MELDVNKKYYIAAVKAIGNLCYYYNNFKKDIAAYLKHYFPDAVEDDLLCAIEKAIKDIFENDCEVEIVD